MPGFPVVARHGADLLPPGEIQEAADLLLSQEGWTKPPAPSREDSTDHLPDRLKGIPKKASGRPHRASGEASRMLPPAFTAEPSQEPLRIPRMGALHHQWKTEGIPDFSRDMEEKYPEPRLPL